MTSTLTVEERLAELRQQRAETIGIRDQVDAEIATLTQQQQPPAERYPDSFEFAGLHGSRGVTVGTRVIYEDGAVDAGYFRLVPKPSDSQYRTNRKHYYASAIDGAKADLKAIESTLAGAGCCFQWQQRHDRYYGALPPRASLKEQRLKVEVELARLEQNQAAFLAEYDQQR